MKENLVEKPQDWPGVHFVNELLRGDYEVHGGEWHDQTAEFQARRRGEKINRRDFIQRELIVLSPLPCLDQHSKQQIRELIRGLVKDIEQQAKKRHQALGTRPLGVKKIQRQNPYEKPTQTKTSPAPWAHAATKAVYKDMRNAYFRFELALRRAAQKLKDGILYAEFPPGSFPPARPFVPELEPGAA